MADPVVSITGGVPTSGTGTITTLGQVVAPQGASTSTGESGTSGPVRGPLVQGATLTSAPTYTTGTVNPLTTTLAGALRVDGSGVTQPISGTITANQGGAPWSMKPDGTTWAMTSTSANVNVTNGSIAVTGTFWQTTQPVSGTVTANQGGSNWTQNVTQFGGTNISTGTGASGTGIPRVTVANDSQVRVLGNAGGAFDFASTQNIATPAQTVLIGAEFNTAPTTITSGNSSPLQLDSVANLKVVQPWSSLTTAAWNSSTTVGTWQAFAFGTNIYDSIVGSLVTTTTITGGAVTFEESYDGNTTFKAIPSSRLIDPITGAQLANPYTLTANGNQQWSIITTGAAFIRIRLSTIIAGTGSLTLFWVVGSLANDAQVFQSNPANLATAASGDTANAVTDAGNPVKIGGLAKTTNPTAVSDGQRVNAVFDKQGKQVVVGAIRQLKGVQNTSITSTTETTVVTAGSAGVFNDLYGLTVTNTSATAAYVTIKDSTAGTTRFVIEVPATDTRGFMLPVDSAVPQATAANNWTATVSVATTTMYVTALYVGNT